jgi:hypothetical protein
MSSQLAPEIVYRKLQLVVAASIQATPATAAPARAPGARGTNGPPPPTRQTEGSRLHPQPRNQLFGPLNHGLGMTFSAVASAAHTPYGLCLSSRDSVWPFSH